MTEYWGFGRSEPGRFAEHARADEADGWDGLVFTDSQNLRPDVFVVMATALAATSRLKVTPGVSNPVTRHPAVSASAMAALQAESGGRASYGIGRGDSALAYIGQAPASMAVFETYVRHVQSYLSGGRVPFEELLREGADISTLELGDQPSDSWVRWLDPDVPKVPVEVIATGPKAIGVGGRHADIVTFTVGADLERIAWGIDTARAAAVEAGRDPAELRFGVYVNVACHPDLPTARTLVSGGLASFSRFSAMHGKPVGPLSGGAEHVVRQIRDRYDMKHHGEPESAQTETLTDDFVDRFAVVGGPDRFRERVAEIVALGIDRVVMTIPNQATRERYPDETTVAHQHLVRDVLPRLPR
ncbi:MAG: LLM class flavin-dependent oxidoreductase [Desertimonas sp.]